MDKEGEEEVYTVTLVKESCHNFAADSLVRTLPLSRFSSYTEQRTHRNFNDWTILQKFRAFYHPPPASSLRSFRLESTRFRVDEVLLHNRNKVESHGTCLAYGCNPPRNVLAP